MNPLTQMQGCMLSGTATALTIDGHGYVIVSTGPAGLENIWKRLKIRDPLDTTRLLPVVIISEHSLR